MKRFLASFVAVALMLVVGSAAFAQAYNTGAVKVNIVSDIDGDPLPGVECTLNTSSHNFTVITNSMGVALFRMVPVGQYQFKAILYGFETYVRAGVPVSIGQTTTVSARLKLANQ